MLKKFWEAIRLLSSNLPLFSSIILTVWLPGNLVVSYLSYNVLGEEEIFELIKITMLIEGVFGPIYIGAMIYVLSKLKQGYGVSYSEAIAVGLRKWGKLFVAQFVAGLIIVLGLIALIVPGVILLVRYALLDAAVILEGAGTSESRRRSTELTIGIRWQIFGAAVLFFIGFIVLTFLISIPLGFIEPLNTMIVDVVLGCILNIVYAVIQLVLFLFYWEARAKEKSLGKSIKEPNPCP